ncbi:D-glycerate dehydrogenase [Candidatus Uhrbacteria bacterium]|nr:D-glycerate dehydrogenase [Candidatus Uhrbacteria bacterium]
MQKVFVTRPISRVGIDILKNAGYKVTLQPKPINLSQKELLTRVKGYDALLTLLTNKIDAAIMDAAGPQLKVISNYAVGFDNIDIEAAKKRNIIVTNTALPEINESVAEHTFALILALAHRLVEADRFTRAGKYHGWDPQLFLGRDIAGLTLGLIGLGNIGKMVARRASAFAMNILYHDVRRDEEFEKSFSARHLFLEQLLSQSDIVSLHVPLLPSTRHLISTKQLRLMKKDALLINTARGPVVDETATLKALYQKKIGGFALDVYECEPAIDCNPRDRYELRKLSNVIMTPHTASATVRTRDAMSRLAAQNIIDALSGKKSTASVT